MKDSTERFSDRVADYVRYRPGYPAELLPFLQKERCLRAGIPVADIGSGTGILTRLLLDAGHTVYAVEPNTPMRTAAESRLGGYDRLISVAGTAEATGLQDGSVDLITAAQAFHWFDPQAAKKEFRRIARPDAFQALIWNERQVSTPLLSEYDQLVGEFAIDYARVDHRNITSDQLQRFFDPAPMHSQEFRLQQRFDLTGLRGRLLSSSYIPQNNQEGRFDEMLSALSGLFRRHSQDGLITLEYITRLYYGRVHPQG